MTMYLFSFLLLVGSLTAKELKIPINDTTSYTYIDRNNDARFDAVIIQKGEDYQLKKLKKMVRRPHVKLYKKSTLSYRVVNYNNKWDDATFRINLIHNGEVIGFWEKYLGYLELKYKEISKN